MARPFIFVSVARPPNSNAVEVKLQNGSTIIAHYCPQSEQWFRGPDGPMEGEPLASDAVHSWRPLPVKVTSDLVPCGAT